MAVSHHYYYMPVRGEFSPGVPLVIQGLLLELWALVPAASEPPREGQRIICPMDGPSFWVCDGAVVAALNWATYHPETDRPVRPRSDRPDNATVTALKQRFLEAL